MMYLRAQPKTAPALKCKVLRRVGLYVNASAYVPSPSPDRPSAAVSHPDWVFELRYDGFAWQRQCAGFVSKRAKGALGWSALSGNGC